MNKMAPFLDTLEKCHNFMDKCPIYYMTTGESNPAKILDRKTAVMLKAIQGNGKTVEFKLKGRVTFGTFISDKMLVIDVIRQGIPYSYFNDIQDIAPFRSEDWSRLLNISSKTLLRYKQTRQKFKPLQSEKIIEMAEVTHTGLEVFGNMEKFRLWLDTPSFALGNSKPIDLLEDSYGKELVLTELNNINYGILA
jgi:putative toxin-antitoxin system antitoxin component (TIGR02293 family)